MKSTVSNHRCVSLLGQIRNELSHLDMYLKRASKEMSTLKRLSVKSEPIEVLQRALASLADQLSPEDTINAVANLTKALKNIEKAEKQYYKLFYDNEERQSLERANKQKESVNKNKKAKYTKKDEQENNDGQEST